MIANLTQMTMNLFGARDAMPNLESASALERINLQTRMDSLMSLREACLASLQASSAKGVEVLMNVGCGPTPCELLENCGLDLSSSKTRAQSFPLKEEGRSVESLEPVPISGIMCNGMLYPLPPLVQAIDAKDSGFWLPTPIARDWKDTPGMAKESGKRKRDDTLPRKIYAREKSPPRSGIINPEFSLWLMGYPDGWLRTS